jgi:hypothetical protein
MSEKNFMRSRASEFPNDNAALHGGAVWVVSEPCGAWWAEPAREDEESGATPTAIATPTATATPTVNLDTEPNPMTTPTPIPDESTATQSTEADDPYGDESIEIVDQLEPIDFDPANREDDAFATFIATLVDVAVEAGCEKAAAILPALLDEGRVVPGVLSSSVIEALLTSGLLVSTAAGLVGGEGFRRTAAAWRAVLRGDSEDFSACGTRMLDEWAADLVAGLVAAPAKTERLRRELRTRGVAAFGLVLAA